MGFPGGRHHVAALHRLCRGLPVDRNPRRHRAFVDRGVSPRPCHACRGADRAPGLPEHGPADVRALGRCGVGGGESVSEGTATRPLGQMALSVDLNQTEYGHMAPVSGWYQDPSDPGLMRYWDGAKWTDATGPMP